MLILRGANANVTGDLDWEGSEAENEMMSDISGDNVLMLEESDWNSTPNSSDLMMLVPAAQDSPTYEQISLPGSSTQLALLPSSASTSTSESMAVAVPGDRSIVRIGQSGIAGN